MALQTLDHPSEPSPVMLETIFLDPRNAADGGDVAATPSQVGFAEVTNGRLHWHGSLAEPGRRLASFHRRLVTAIVRGTPLPIECLGIREADRLVARLEAIWAGYAEARRLDPDPESWIQTLEFASGPLFIDWCHTLCCEVLGEPIDRLPTDDGSGDEHWFSLAADDLAAHLQAVLRGEGAFSPQDPIRVPWRRSA